MFESVRADIIAEHFQKEHNASPLFIVPKELDDHAHSSQWPRSAPMSSAAKTILGVYSDFVQTKRVALLNDGAGNRVSPAGSTDNFASRYRSSKSFHDYWRNSEQANLIVARIFWTRKINVIRADWI